MKKYLSKIIAQDEAGLQMISACVSKAKVKASEMAVVPNKAALNISRPNPDIRLKVVKAVITHTDFIQ